MILYNYIVSKIYGGFYMSIIADSHVHSSFSGDSNANMEEMVVKAMDLGLKYITFTEHQDFDFIYTEDEPKEKFEVNTDQYLYHLLGLREKYASKITVNFGIEIGMQTDIARKNAKKSKMSAYEAYKAKNTEDWSKISNIFGF